MLWRHRPSRGPRRRRPGPRPGPGRPSRRGCSRRPRPRRARGRRRASRWTGGGNDRARALEPGELRGEVAYRAGGGVHQDRLPGLELPVTQHAQRDGCRAGQETRGGVVEVVGYLGGPRGVDDHVIGEGVLLRERGDPPADQPGVHSGPGLLDDPDHVAGRRPRQRQGEQRPGRRPAPELGVDEVGADRRRTDAELPICGDRDVRLLDFQHFRAAVLVVPDSAHGILLPDEHNWTAGQSNRT